MGEKKIRTKISIGGLSTTCSMYMSDFKKNLDRNKAFYGMGLEITEEQKEMIMTFAVLDSLSHGSLLSVARKFDIMLIPNEDIGWGYVPTTRGFYYPTFNIKVGLKYNDFV